MPKFASTTRLTAPDGWDRNISWLKEVAKAAGAVDVSEIDDGAELEFYLPEGSKLTKGQLQALLDTWDGTQKSTSELANEQRQADIAIVKDGAETIEARFEALARAMGIEV